MNDESVCLSFLRLNQLPIAGRRPAAELLFQGVSVLEIEAKILAENFLGQAEALTKIRQSFSGERELEQCAKKNIQILTLTCSEYPRALAQIFDPPWVLYVKGKILAEDIAAVAAVGTRHPSYYGKDQAIKFSKRLTEVGLTIVSGLARGIDQFAHEAALQVPYGRTIAVLGCGVDHCYPASNRKLYEMIPEKGAVISEYPLGTEPRAHHFPARNRIIAGLSQGVLVVEAHHRSGALITAHEAIDEGREVFAIPGPIDQLTSRGTHRLLKEGALLVEDPQDILDVIVPGLVRDRYLHAPLPSIETIEIPVVEANPQVGALQISESDRGLLQMLREGPKTHDELMDLAGAHQVMGDLLRLELAGEIIKQPDGKFAKADRR